MKVAYQKVKSFIKSVYIPKKETDIIDTSTTFLELGSQLVQAATDAKKVHYALLNRERILSVINHAAFNFLEVDINAWGHLSSFIKRLGQLMNVDRIFILRHNKDIDTLSILENYIYEKPGMGVSLFKVISQFKNIHHEKDFEFYFQTRITTWRANEKLKPFIKHYLHVFRIRSLCVVPIITNNNLLGTIVVQDCSSPRIWSRLEISTLQIVSNLLSAWWKRSALEDSLKSHQEKLEETVKERTEELYRSTEIFRSLTESSPDSILRFNCRYQCIFVNKKVTLHSGVSMSNFLSSPLDKIFSIETFRIIKNILDYVIENSEGFNIELQFPKTKLWIDWKFKPELDSSNKVYAVIAVGRNITRRKAADKTLIEYLDFQTESAIVQESSYKAIFEILGFPAIICNTSDLIVDANRLAKKLFFNKQLIGVKCSDLLVNKDCIVKYKQQIQEDKNTESCQFLGELKNKAEIYNVTLSMISNTKNFVCVFEKKC